MSLHKLTAGSGYDYLTRQVAALDATDKGHTGLASYYGARGESPGRWVGSGLTGIAGLEPGAEVTAEQMQALFGEGRHPLAADIRAAVLRSSAGPAEAEAEAAGRLGAPFRVYSPDVTSFRQQVAARVAGANREAGLPPDWPVAPGERARLRTEVATEFFRREHGRDPLDSRELAATVARESRPRTTAVAGYDLTFSPVKSVSTLWALADPPIAAQVEAAHHAAVAAALQFIERHALFTRQGANGVRQVETRGLVAAAFDHRDSRTGDPDLHTHVAVANKVQSRDGSWLAIDGRVLFKAAVTASETYNTALEHELSHRLGVRFAVRAQSDLRKRPVREVTGVDEALNARWSARRRSIETRQHELVARFQGDHGRPPTPVETVQLAQRATLETRDAKHEPRSYAEQRATWRAQALEVLGSPRRLRAMISATLQPGVTSRADLDGAQLGELARTVVERVEEQRATWQRWHIRAEAQRQVRGLTSGRETEGLVDAIEQRALAHHSVALAPPADEPAEPDLLRRIDGTSVYHVAGSDSYTSRQILAAEQRLVEVGSRVDGRRLDPGRLHDALRETPAEDPPLDPGQRALVTQLSTSGRRLQLAVAPAGAGKTTALAALAV